MCRWHQVADAHIYLNGLNSIQVGEEIHNLQCIVIANYQFILHRIRLQSSMPEHLCHVCKFALPKACAYSLQYSGPGSDPFRWKTLQSSLNEGQTYTCSWSHFPLLVIAWCNIVNNHKYLIVDVKYDKISDTKSMTILSMKKLWFWMPASSMPASSAYNKHQEWAKL